MIIDQLRSPQKTFKVQEDGSETVEYRPPTALMLHAANVIEQMDRAIKVLQLELTNIKNGTQQ